MAQKTVKATEAVRIQSFLMDFQAAKVKENIRCRQRLK
jgi:hypothetical protein